MHRHKSNTVQSSVCWRPYRPSLLHSAFAGPSYVVTFLHSTHIDLSTHRVVLVRLVSEPILEPIPAVGICRCTLALTLVLALTVLADGLLSPVCGGFF